MKKLSKNALAIITLSVSSLLIVGTGFASWTIVNLSDSTSLNGNISADTMGDVSIVAIEDAKFVEGTEIYFGSPANPDKTEYSWFQSKATQHECLTAKYTFTAVYTTTTEPTVAITLEETDEGNAYATAYEKGFVGSLPSTSGSKDGKEGTITCEKDGDATTTTANNVNYYRQKYNVNVNFVWGSAFGYKNPYYYYNSKAFTVELSQEATQHLNEYPNGASYKLTINLTGTRNAQE